MSKYSELQKDFAAMIRENNLNPVLNEIRPGGELEPLQALLVYQGGYYARMTEAMGETFEAVWRMLGDEKFFSVCREFITQTKSESYNISEYGNAFPHFLKIRFTELPLLSEIASFEIVFRDLFHTKYHFSYPDFSKLTGPETKIIFNTNVRLLTFSGPVYSIWKNRNEENFSISDLSLDASESILLYKAEDNTIYAQELDSELMAVAQKLEAGVSIAEALERIEESSENKINEFFSFLSSSGIIENIE